MRPMAESRWSFVELKNGEADIFLHDDTTSPGRKRLLLRATGPNGVAQASEMVQARNRILRMRRPTSDVA